MLSLTAARTAIRNFTSQSLTGLPGENIARTALFHLGNAFPTFAYQQRALHAASLILRKNTACVTVDVGANHGTFLDHFMHHAPLGTHYAFEPIAEMAEALQKHYPHARIHAIALNNRNQDDAPFYYYPKKPNSSGLQRHVALDTQFALEHRRVAVSTLDRCIPDSDKRRVGIVKIDVEGLEFFVIDGAKETLAHCPPILFEFMPNFAETCKVSPERLYTQLHSLGYYIWNINDWIRGERSLTLPTFAQQALSGKIPDFIAHTRHHSDSWDSPERHHFTK